MGVPYAELIGDPVAYSKSPVVHQFWLGKLGLAGDYRVARLKPDALRSYLRERCDDPFWRGCNVTAPLKAAAAALAVDPTGLCRRIGAANAVFRSPLGCGVGANTDLAGIAEALAGLEDAPRRACVIGAGGAARTALELLRVEGTAEIALVVRDPARTAGAAAARVHRFEESADAMAGADCVINATPLGMEGAPPMPAAVLDAVAATREGALVFDMVYVPVETALLARARAEGRRVVDGLAMLIGQAAPSFELFFGAPAPRERDSELRELLTS